MTNEEMKELKFKTMIDELYNKMGSTPINFKDNNGILSGMEVLLGNKDEDPYLKIIFTEYSNGMFVYFYSNCTSKYNSICQVCTKTLPASIENLISNSKRCNICEKNNMKVKQDENKDNNNTYACSLPAQTIFFSLMALAVNEKLYEEKLETVSDAAYMMGFNEEMIEDWITVVKKFLMAETIDSKQLKTEEAKHFFSFFNE